MPRTYFENHVKPSVENWTASPLEEWRAKNAIGELNIMAARVFHHWRALDPAKVYGATSEGRYRDELAARECADFALVRDVGDAHKHVELVH